MSLPPRTAWSSRWPMRSAAFLLLVLLCLLHGCAGVPASLSSVFVPHGQRALLDSDMCVFMSGGAFELSHISNSSARDLQHWTWRLQCCFAGTGHQNVLDIPKKGHLASSGSSAPVFAPVHLHDVLIAPFREWKLLCCLAVFWHCISGHCTSAGTSTFMYCCYETWVICCTFCPVLLMYCTCGNFDGLCTWWISSLCTLNLGSRDLLGHLIHFSGWSDSFFAQSFWWFGTVLLVHDQSNFALLVYRLPTGFSLRADCVALFHLYCVDDVLRGFCVQLSFGTSLINSSLLTWVAWLVTRVKSVSLCSLSLLLATAHKLSVNLLSNVSSFCSLLDPGWAELDWARLRYHVCC